MAKASTIHCSWVEVACRLRTIDGRATLRIVLSRLMSNKVTQRTANVARRRPRDTAVSWIFRLPVGSMSARRERSVTIRMLGLLIRTVGALAIGPEHSRQNLHTLVYLTRSASLRSAGTASDRPWSSEHCHESGGAIRRKPAQQLARCGHDVDTPWTSAGRSYESAWAESMVERMGAGSFGAASDERGPVSALSDGRCGTGSRGRTSRVCDKVVGTLLNG